MGSNVVKMGSNADRFIVWIRNCSITALHLLPQLDCWPYSVLTCTLTVMFGQRSTLNNWYLSGIAAEGSSCEAALVCLRVLARNH